MRIESKHKFDEGKFAIGVMIDDVNQSENKKRFKKYFTESESLEIEKEYAERMKEKSITASDLLVTTLIENCDDFEERIHDLMRDAYSILSDVIIEVLKKDDNDMALDAWMEEKKLYPEDRILKPIIVNL